MKSLKLSDLIALQTSGACAGSYTVLLHGAPRTIQYHPNWPANRHQLLSARETHEYAVKYKGELQ